MEETVQALDVRRTAGQTLPKYRVARYHGGGLRLPSLAVLVHASAIAGVVLDDYASGAEAEIRTYGPLHDDEWDWTPGPLYVGTDGALVQAAPEDGYVVEIGWAETANNIWIRQRRIIHYRRAFSIASEITIDHGLGRYVGVAVLDATGAKLLADEQQTASQLVVRPSPAASGVILFW